MNPSQLVLIGFGAVSKSLMTLMCIVNPKLAYQLPIVIIEPKNINNSEIYNKLRKNNTKIIHIKMKLLKNNYAQIFKKFINNDAIVIDLSYRVDTTSMIQQCQHKRCLYICTAIDNWTHNQTPLFNVKQSIVNNVHEPKMTAVLNHGMNPGLISHFMKFLLGRLAEESLDDKNISFYKQGKYNYLAENLGLTLIQIAERDNQSSKYLSSEKNYYNTWSIIGFLDEALIPTEISWGTHEKLLPYKAQTSMLKESGQIILPLLGYQVTTKSFEPKGGIFTGYCIPHAECYSLGDLLRIGDQYRPSIYYSYLISDTAKLMCHYSEYTLNDDYQPIYEHVLRSDEIMNGYDSVGCLAFFKKPTEDKIKKYWIGSILSNKFAQQISPEVNATCLQVGIGVLACVEWMLLNPHMGIIEPEVIDSDFIIDYCRDWLGEFFYDDVSKSCEIQTDQFSDLLVSPHNILF